MKYMRPLFITILFIFTNPVIASPDPYIIATQPKGGSYLLIKALNMILTSRTPRLFCHYDAIHFQPKMLEEWWYSGGLPWVHLFSPIFTYNYFQSYHPDFKVIVIIRDIRDAYVSYGHWVYRDCDISEEEKINRVFHDGAYFDMSRHLSLFLDHPRFYVIRFEDLVGPKGGGSKERQTQVIYDLAAYIGIPISTSLAEEYGDALFGDSGHTFRKGKIGSWKEACNEEQKQWLKENFGDELIRLGYEQDEKW